MREIIEADVEMLQLRESRQRVGQIDEPILRQVESLDALTRRR